MQITGTIIEIAVEELLPNGVKKITFVLTEESPFPSELPFDLFNEKIALIEKFKVGDRVSLMCRPRGFSKVTEEGEVKRWTSLRPYRITLFNNSIQIQQLNQTTEEPNNGNEQ